MVDPGYPRPQRVDNLSTELHLNFSSIPKDGSDIHQEVGLTHVHCFENLLIAESSLSKLQM